jgi:hypothetical protein
LRSAPLIGPAQVAARIVEMAIGDYHHPIWTLVASVSLIAMGLSLLWIGAAKLAVALLCYSAGSGIWSIARGTLPWALFGPYGYAELMGRLAMPSLMAQSLAPTLGALLLENVGASGTLAVLSGLALLNVVLVASLWLCARRLIITAPV